MGFNDSVVENLLKMLMFYNKYFYLNLYQYFLKQIKVTTES